MRSKALPATEIWHFKKFQLKNQVCLNLIAEWMQRFFITFLHIMTRLYLEVQMKSLKDFKCGWIIHNVDIKRGKHSQLFGEITIKASPPIYTFIWLLKQKNKTQITTDRLCQLYPQPEKRLVEGNPYYSINLCLNFR